jgi:hypothetical protein
MLPKHHILIGFIVSSAILLIWPAIGLFNFGIFFFSSFLIDFDHYLYFIWTKNDFSLAHAYKWFVAKGEFLRSLPLGKKAEYKQVVLIFHGIESWLFLFLLFLFNKIFIWVLAGIAIHMIFDFVELVVYKNPLYTKISQIYVLITNKNKKPLPSHFNKVIL